ncbi:hypothetical protein TD95_003816 [Thielaviopsis punctulata]|uniref:Cytochrome b561 domain-containing protein n=1 Tax=Thielaviopsis punctulata TaxID=72032 RepID=A0A0F4ZGT9_9PEZI|nr:hypothetical protein TD95_003816 [Thielaviopsis punctulata]
MAPAADDLSGAGTVAYNSDTMSVGDGTWDYTKNSFLLPNLQGLNFDTMRYNGMGNRFSTWPQYHRLIVAHAVLAAIVFLVLVPFAVFAPRFMRSASRALKWHTQMLILGGLLFTASFMLGFFAVGPKRNLTNPHHGIGVAVYVIYVCYVVADQIVNRIKKDHSLRRYIHMWTGRVLVLLGLIQIPLGLTLYGSPLVLFILYSVYTAFLLLFYLFLDFKSDGFRGRGSYSHEHIEVHTTKVDKHKHENKWLAPLAAFAGFMMLKNLRKERSRSKSRSRSRARSQSRARSHSRARSESYSRSRLGPSTLGSHEETVSYMYNDEKSEAPRKMGFFGKLLAAGAALGGAKAASNWTRKREERRYDQEYSDVSGPVSHHKPPRALESESYWSEDFESRAGTSRVADSRYTDSRVADSRYTDSRVADSRYTDSRVADSRYADSRVADSRMTDSRITASQYTVYSDSRVTAPQGTEYTGAASAVSAPRRQRSVSRSVARSRLEHDDEDDGYESPSRRLAKQVSRENVAKGILGGMGIGWLANKWRNNKKEEEEKLHHEVDDGRSRVSGSVFTTDGYDSPPRRSSTHRNRTRTTLNNSSYFSDEDADSDMYSSRHPASTMPPASTLPPSTAAPSDMSPSDLASSVPPSTLPPVSGRSDNRRDRSRSRSRGRYNDSEMNSRLDSVSSLPAGSRYQRRTSSSRRRAGEAAAATAAASASVLAREQAKDMSKHGRSSQPPHRRSDDDDSSSAFGDTPTRKSAKTRVTIDGDKERVTLRRLTDEEAAARKSHARRDSLSSISSNETPTGRRYRRESARGSSGDSNVPPSGSQSRHTGSTTKDPYYASNRTPPQSPRGGRHPDLTKMDSQDSMVSPSVDSIAENNRNRRRLERRQTVTSADFPPL